MDVTPTPTPKSPEPDTETPTRIQPTKPISFTNGVLKRHHHHHHHLVVITYKECLKNHAASLGGHALDGCGEFMPSPSSTPSDPTSLKCAACGCHRNFHRRDPEDPPPTNTTTTALEYQPHHRHHPPPPPSHRSPNSASPPPISSAYYPSAPHMLLALSGSGLHSHPDNNINSNNNNNHMGSNSHVNLSSAAVGAMSNQNPSSRKRFRTKFSQFQKDRMLEFAERVGWKMQKRDEDLVRELCSEVGVDKGVLKVWMHNNKNTFGKRDINGGGGRTGNMDNNDNNSENNNNDNSNDDNNNDGSHGHNLNHHRFESDSHVAHVGTNGSSSSS